ncbi:MAG: hypothetical protein AABZ16_04400 [candidate division NC10 bacterium]
MLTTNSAPETASTVTGMLLDLIQQGKVSKDRLARENAYLRGEVARLAHENAELRACLPRKGDTLS